MQSKPSHKRYKKHQLLLERRRAIKIIFVLLVPLWLAFYGDAKRADVATRVKGAQRDGMFAGTKAAEVD